MNASFNQLLVSRPACIVGNAKGYAAKAFFQADEKKKEDVEMVF